MGHSRNGRFIGLSAAKPNSGQCEIRESSARSKGVSQVPYRILNEPASRLDLDDVAPSADFYSMVTRRRAEATLGQSSNPGCRDPVVLIK